MISNEEGVIHQGTFLLAEEAKTGIYTIRVTGKNSASCSFSVEEYVLPKFGVEIEGLFEYFYITSYLARHSLCAALFTVPLLVYP